MIGYASLLQAGLSIDEAYHAIRKRMTPEILACLAELRRAAPELFAAYEAQWHKAGLNPPWEGLLDDPESL